MPGHTRRRAGRANKGPLLPASLAADLGFDEDSGLFARPAFQARNTQKRGPKVRGKRTRPQDDSAPQRPTTTYFQREIDSENQYQLQLAKKLKLSKASSSFGLEDGLDGLLSGLEHLATGQTARTHKRSKQLGHPGGHASREATAGTQSDADDDDSGYGGDAAGELEAHADSDNNHNDDDDDDDDDEDNDEDGDTSADGDEDGDGDDDAELESDDGNGDSLDDGVERCGGDGSSGSDTDASSKLSDLLDAAELEQAGPRQATRRRWPEASTAARPAGQLRGALQSAAAADVADDDDGDNDELRARRTAAADRACSPSTPLKRIDRTATGADSDAAQLGIRGSGATGASLSKAADEAAADGQSGKQAGKYVPPGRRMPAGTAGDGGGRGSKAAVARTRGRGAGEPQVEDAVATVHRQLRSLLNRVASTNIGGVASQVAGCFERVAHSVAVEAVVASLMQAVADGPRAADQFAAVSAALVTIVAVSVPARDLLARLLTALAAALQRALEKEDAIASSNCARLVCYLYVCKAIGGDIVYSLLHWLQSSFSAATVSLIASILNAVGLRLRGDDAPSMKSFVQAVHERAAAHVAADAVQTRIRLMLEVVTDVKNNRKRGPGGARGGLVAELPPEIHQLLKGIGVENIALQGLSWEKVLDGSTEGAVRRGEESAEFGAGGADAAVHAGVSLAAAQDARLLKLAAAQRMNTSTRRAVFCVIMAAEDYMDAYEKVTRLPLKPGAEREIPRILLHCCLQEAAWNAFYGMLAVQLADGSRHHRTTFQFCVWDRLKELEGLAVRKAFVLARFVACLLARQALPIISLKVEDFRALSASRSIFWRTVMVHMLLEVESSDTLQRMMESLCRQAAVKRGLRGFLKGVVHRFVTGAVAGDTQLGEEARKSVVDRCELACGWLRGKGSA